MRTVVARVLGVNRTSFYRRRKAADQGPQALAALPQRGPTPRLSDDQLRELDGLLRHGAAHHGWPNCLWTTARVAQLIRRHFGVSFRPDHVGPPRPAPAPLLYCHSGKARRSESKGTPVFVSRLPDD
ncbi:MAG: winged helix-turn-helix domain-containing protein [Planctomycetia bacterium]|nr:winged helix-turn-helix domain-containing protein [Planctomycetia bacterium]